MGGPQDKLKTTGGPDSSGTARDRRMGADGAGAGGERVDIEKGTGQMAPFGSNVTVHSLREERTRAV